MIVEWLYIVLLGIVEGVTEFLPISSTGHLLIVENFFGSKPDAFTFIIQAGAVIAVVAIYHRRLIDLIIHFRDPQRQTYIAKLALAFGVSAIGGLIAKQFGFQLPDTVRPVAIALIVGGVVIFLAERHLKYHKPSDSISWNMAAWVGASQILAYIFPGTSRSAATIIAAMFCGASRPAATEFSFLLGIPTLMAASAYYFKEGWETGQFYSNELLNELVIGFLVSMTTAFIVVKWLIRFVRSHTFISFAWYRLILGAILIVILWNHSENYLPADLAKVFSFLPSPTTGNYFFKNL